MIQAANPKLTSYSPDGFGRDTYIMVNNGGIHRDLKSPRNGSQSPRRREYSSPSPRLESKPIKYRPDGSGRDFYITTNHGGLFKQNPNGTFYNSLRKDERRVTPDPFIRTVQSWLPSFEMAKSRAAYNQQQSAVRRLSQPRTRQIERTFISPMKK